jgi:hypothetical protein
VFIVFIIYRWTEISREREFQFRFQTQDNLHSSARAEIEEREKKDSKHLRTVFLISGVILFWQGIWVPTSNHNYEKNQSKLQYEAYLSGNFY